MNWVIDSFHRENVIKPVVDHEDLYIRIYQGNGITTAVIIPQKDPETAKDNFPTLNLSLPSESPEALIEAKKWVSQQYNYFFGRGKKILYFDTEVDWTGI